METISLNELLGLKIKKIFSGSELMFLYELNRYSKEILKKELDLEDVSIVKELKKCDYFSYVYTKGLDVNYYPKREELVDIGEISRKFFTSDLSGVVFEKKTAKEWVYSYTTDRRANLILNQYNRSGGYVSLYAYMVVKSYESGKKVPKLILKNNSPKQEEMEYLDIIILKNFGNKLLEGKVEIEYSTEVVVQPEWEAFVMYHRQLGHMLTDSTSLEKYKYTVKNFEVGDVVLFYKTEKAIKSKTIRRLINCYPATILAITKEGVKLEYYPDITTELTHKRILEGIQEKYEGEYSYSPEDFSRFSKCGITVSYINMGIDHLLYQEDEFIMAPLNGIDTFEQYLVDKNGIEGVYKLDTLNNIYAVFEDRKITYNKDRFLNKYFKDTKPKYDKVLGR
jgi:hypothetical protein